MRVLVTGARGFIGKNLCESLENIRTGKDRRADRSALLPLEVYECDSDSTMQELATWCARCDFVVHLAGVNRPHDPREFGRNVSGLLEVLERLEEAHNRCPVLLASSVQASLQGAYKGSAYGKSKLEAEDALRAHGKSHGSEVLIFRLPNVYGKWCRPNYNSAVATFCDAIANGRPYHVSDPDVELELLYVDDLVEGIVRALLGEVRRCVYDGARMVPDAEGDFCYVPQTDRATLGEIVGMLQGFKATRESLLVPDLPEGSLPKKLHSTYLSYQDPSTCAYPLRARTDERGGFVEFLRMPGHGQVSVNISRPGATKGNHWHHSKVEKFLVVCGEALIRLRRVGEDAEGMPHPVTEWHVSGVEPTVVEMLPGYAHSITNLSLDRDLVALIWASEMFDPERPDTYFEEV